MLSTREAAQRVGLTREQLLRRVERGEIHGRFKDGKWYIDPRSLEEYAAARELARVEP
jgi:DNA-binding Lrp family transcriptional regulator